jgi:hypothetical protein
MTTKIRAILIDPERRTLTEIQIEDDYRKTKEVLGCRCFTGGPTLNGSLDEGFDAVYVSDDPLEDRDDPRFWFEVDADHNPHSCPFAGLGLVLGSDDMGEGRDANISVDELAARITFTQRKFPGFEISPLRGDHVSVAVKAPIIDGPNEQ